MADVTLEDVYLRAGRRLQVVEAGEAMTAEDREVFATTYPAVYAMLEGRGLVQWDITQAIPQRYAQPVIDLLAATAAPDFATTFDASAAIPELARQVAPAYRYDETVFKDF